MVHICNPGIQEVEAGMSLCSLVYIKTNQQTTTTTKITNK
jgi:hypothetical protein